MTPPSARRFERGTVQVHLWTAGHALRFVGVMREVDVSAWLMPLIEEVHAAAVERKLSVVELDIRDLEYANAALWRCLVLWLKRIREQEGARYNLLLFTRSRHRWQGVGVPTLRAFSVDPRGEERLIVAPTAA